MKKLLLTALLILITASFTWAGSIAIDSSETINTPAEATKILFTDIGLNFDDNTRTVKFRYVDTNGGPLRIHPSDLPANTEFVNWKKDWLIWTCKDEDVNRYDNSACVDSEDPSACCTGLGIGSCNETAGNCWEYVMETSCGPTYCDNKTLTQLLRDRLKVEFLIDVLPTFGNSGDYEQPIGD